MKTIYKGDNYDVCKLTPRDAQQLGAVGRFAVLDRFYGKANSFNSVCNVFVTEQEARNWVTEHDRTRLEATG